MTVALLPPLLMGPPDERIIVDSRERHGEIVEDGHYPDITWRRLYRRVGKKAAGRELDGRTWDQYPQAVTA